MGFDSASIKWGHSRLNIQLQNRMAEKKFIKYALHAERVDRHIESQLS